MNWTREVMAKPMVQHEYKERGEGNNKRTTCSYLKLFSFLGKDNPATAHFHNFQNLVTGAILDFDFTHKIKCLMFPFC